MHIYTYIHIYTHTDGYFDLDNAVVPRSFCLATRPWCMWGLGSLGGALKRDGLGEG